MHVPRTPSLPPTHVPTTTIRNSPSIFPKLLLREAGMGGPWDSRALFGPQQRADALTHHRTVRGHRAVVYCSVCDPRGRYLVTGADDRLVKVVGAV